MASALEQDICQIAFLVNDTGEFVVIVKPGCQGLARKPLNTSECHILLTDQ